MGSDIISEEEEEDEEEVERTSRLAVDNELALISNSRVLQ